MTDEMSDIEIKSMADRVVDGDEAAVKAIIFAGISTPQILAELIDDAELVDDCLVLSPGEWHADDGNAEITGEFDNGEEAAESYVRGGDWGEDSKTHWIEVRVWREGVDANGDVAEVDEESHTITVEASEPKCTESEHDWQSPAEILGGCKENPGVWGHGGGVIITEVCMNCGCARITDTWAQNPSNGDQGLRSVEYEEGKYTEELASLKEEEAG